MVQHIYSERLQKRSLEKTVIAGAADDEDNRMSHQLSRITVQGVRKAYSLESGDI